MARGFESKDIEYQQAEAERSVAPRRTLTPEQRERETKRTTLLLSLARARADLEAAKSSRHEQMLQRAIADLERELASARDDT